MKLHMQDWQLEMGSEKLPSRVPSPAWDDAAHQGLCPHGSESLYPLFWLQSLLWTLSGALGLPHLHGCVGVGLLLSLSDLSGVQGSGAMPPHVLRVSGRHAFQMCLGKDPDGPEQTLWASNLLLGAGHGLVLGPLSHAAVCPETSPQPLHRG